MLLTGRRIDGAEALALGLASRLAAPGECTAEALEIARRLADGPAEAIAATKRLAVAASEVHDRRGPGARARRVGADAPLALVPGGPHRLRRAAPARLRRGPPRRDAARPDLPERAGRGASAPSRSSSTARNELGETPIWDEAAGLLHWVDIFAGAVWSLDPASGEARHFEHGTVVGSVVPRERGGLVLAAGRALVATDLDGGGAETLVEVEPDRPENRFNDCRVDPAGRFFGGTKVNDPELEGRGALYRIGPDLSPTVAIADTGIANGIGWSPDGATLYFIDSPLQRLDAYEFDPATGDLGARRTVATIDPEDGLPDGLTVDAEGGIWVALVRTSTVRRYSPEGAHRSRTPHPGPQPDLPRLRRRRPADPLPDERPPPHDPHTPTTHPQAGALFALDVGVPGLPIPAFAG